MYVLLDKETGELHTYCHVDPEGIEYDGYRVAPIFNTLKEVKQYVKGLNYPTGKFLVAGTPTGGEAWKGNLIANQPKI